MSCPFGVSGRPAARYNPLAWFDAVSPDIAEDAQTIADALVHDAPGQSGEAHWNEEAKALIAGIILHPVVHEPPALATLATVRDELIRDPAGFAALLADMQASNGGCTKTLNVEREWLIGTQNVLSCRLMYRWRMKVTGRF